MKIKKGLLHLIIIFAFALMLSCEGTSTEEYLNGDFIESLGEDTTAPNILIPRNGEKVLIINPANGDPINVALQWTAKNNASYYTVEVANDSEFTDQIEDSPFTVEDVFLELSLTDARRYYWRVRADITEAGQYGSAYFDTMDDTVYVYCPDGEECSDSGMVGNKDYPYRTITAGLDEADRLGLKNVKVAARSATSDVEYFETIPILNGIDLTGGYAPLDPADPDSAFSETDRNIEDNRTVITGEGMNTVFADGIFQETNMDGFVINGPHENKGTFALYILNSSKKLTITNCEITGGESETFYSIGAAIIDSFVILENNTITGGKGIMSGGAIFEGYGCPEIRNNTIAGADLGEDTGNPDDLCDNCESSGIILQWGFPTIENNIIRGGNVIGDDGNSTGINMELDAGPVIQNNIIIAGNVDDGIDGKSTGIKIQDQSRPTITNNIIVSGDADTGDSGSESHGIELDGSDTDLPLTNNTIKSGLGYNSYAIYVDSEDESTNAEPYINYNILFTEDGTGSYYGYYEDNQFSSPKELNYNLFFNAGEGLYFDTYDTDGDPETPGNTQYPLFDDTPLTRAITFDPQDPQNGAGAGTGNITLATDLGETINNVFANYSIYTDPTNPNKWIILSGGVADIELPSGWSEGDIGANAASTGPQ